MGAQLAGEQVDRAGAAADETVDHAGEALGLEAGLPAGRPDLVRAGGGDVIVTLNDGTVLWQQPMPGGGSGGPPTVADFDGDGLPEVGVADLSKYSVFDTDGNGESWGAYLDSFDANLDSDGDSIPDGYEEQFFPGDLTQLGPGDFDGDGVNDPDEYTDGTDPTEADADNDGSNDGQEKAAGTDPLLSLIHI